jgi:hypothetical protein
MAKHMKAQLLTLGAAATMASLAWGQTYQINSVPYTISVPGDYILERNLQSTAPTLIMIAASDVTLDLNGHTLVVRGQYAIHIEGYNVVVKNGSIRETPGAVAAILDTGNGNCIRDCLIAASVGTGILLQGTSWDLVEHNQISCEQNGIVSEFHSVHVSNVIKDNVVNVFAPTGGISLQGNDVSIDNVVVNNG